LQNGASGFLLKSAHPQLLVDAIEAVHSGKQFIDPVIKESLLLEMTEAKNENMHLTLREKEILTLIAREFTNAQIAEQLFISQRTVDNHRLNILFKLGVKNTAGLIKKAMQLGIV
jgi:DNA-binding NarL/FixJ family response regulator